MKRNGLGGEEGGFSATKSLITCGEILVQPSIVAFREFRHLAGRCKVPSRPNGCGFTRTRPPSIFVWFPAVKAGIVGFCPYLIGKRLPSNINLTCLPSEWAVRAKQRHKHRTNRKLSCFGPPR